MRGAHTGGSILLLLVLLALCPGATQAQGGQRDASVAGATAGALLGGTAGFIGGIFVGAGRDNCYELCDDMVYGAVIGEIIGLAVGAHLFNRGRGNLLADLGVSAAIAGAAIGVADATIGSEGGILLMGAAAQLFAVVLTEVRTSPTLTVQPTIDTSVDGTRLGIAMRW